MASDLDAIKTWRKRLASAEKLRGTWEEEYRVRQCYDYWRGDQLANPFDNFGNRKAQVNKIHPEVRNSLPSLYYYRPFARVVAQPELADTPGSEIDSAMQLLQDTANHIIRVQTTRFKESTFLALKEAFWAMGIVETGYSAEFIDDPQADRPPLKEDEDTDIVGKKKESGVESLIGADVALEATLEKEKSTVRGERFYVKHIPSNQLLISSSDKPIVEDNDWVGYWEDVPLEDVKEASAYKNTSDLKATGSSVTDDEESKRMREIDEACGEVDRVRLYKIWDLRTKERFVIAKNHDKFLLRKSFKRLPLHFLRFDVDPYHFWPKPPIYSKLGSQDEYNQSREYLRQVRNGTVPRYTYDEDGIDAEQMRKLESNIMGTYVPRKSGTHQVIEPVQQPSFSENAIQTLTLSDKEFMDAGGVGGDSRVNPTKTATQAKIAEVKDQAQDSFDRELVASWLSSIVKDLLFTAIDRLILDQWIAINVAPDSQFAPMEAQKVSQQYQLLTSQALTQASASVEWDLTIDVESLSPVSEEQKFQKWMQGLSFIGNPGMAMVFAFAPELLRYTLKLMGLNSAREQEMIISAMGSMLQAQQMQQQPQPGAGSPPRTPGVSPMGGGGAPGAPQAPGPTPGPRPGGPQPPSPPGPGASNAPRPM